MVLGQEEVEAEGCPPSSTRQQVPHLGRRPRNVEQLPVGGNGHRGVRLRDVGNEFVAHLRELDPTRVYLDHFKLSYGLTQIAVARRILLFIDMRA